MSFSSHRQVMEGLLRRLGQSPSRDRFVLRGGLVTGSLVAPAIRPAEDVDFLAIEVQPEAEVREQVLAMLRIPVDDDVRFQPETLQTEVIWAETQYPGLRFTMEAAAQGQPVALQLDVAFGDPVLPPPVLLDFPLQSPGPPAAIRAARAESLFGWKLHGLFERSDGRWRPKDLHDLWLMARHAVLDEALLPASVRIAFSSRNTSLSVVYRLLEEAFGFSRRSRNQWSRFRRDHPDRDVPDRLETVVAEVAARLRPIFAKLHAEDHPQAPLLTWVRRPPQPEPQSPFPTIDRIEDVLTAIAGRTEFAQHRRDGYTVLNYEIQLFDTFPDPARALDPQIALHYALRRECRGLIFDDQGRLLCRKFHKFFRLDEREETLFHKQDWSTRPLVLEKLDGSMIAPILLQGRLLLTTKRGVSEISQQAEAFIEASGLPYHRFLLDWIEQGWTPLLEWCSREHRLIVDHPESRLVLTALRENRTGRYLDWAELTEVAAEAGLPLVPSHGQVPEDVRGWLNAVDQETAGEGYVLLWPDGHRLKLKNGRYSRLHGAWDRLEQELPVWNILAHGELPLLLELLTEPRRSLLAQFAAVFQAALARTAHRLEHQVAQLRQSIAQETQHPPEAKKRFAALVADTPALERALLFQIWQDTPAEEALALLLRQSVTQTRSLDRFRPLVENLRWPMDSARVAKPQLG